MVVTAAELASAEIRQQVPAIELVSIGTSTDEVESYVKTIRATGTAVHTSYLSSPEALEAHLETHDLHVILLDARQDSFALKALLDICRSGGVDASVISVGGDPEAFPYPGVRDWLNADNDPRGPWVVVREFGDLIRRRALREAGHRLQETEHRCDALMESSKEAIAYVHEGMHIRANPVYLSLFGLPDAESLEGLPLMDLVSKDARRALRGFLSGTDSSGEGPGYLDVTCRSFAGREFTATLEFAPATIDGEPCVQIIVRQDTSAKEMERLQKLADRDPHTGLYHRNYFLAEVERAIPRLYAEDDQQFALLYVAIDQFAEIRDTSGLDYAERILTEVAGVLAQETPPDVLLARFGDYSFTLFLRIVSDAAAGEFADRLRRAVEAHAFSAVEHLVTPTISLGIARSKQARMKDPHEFINCAYRAFQKASLAGGNQVTEYDPGKQVTSEGADGDAAALDLIEFAVSHKRFTLRFQPMLEPHNSSHDNYYVHLFLRDADDRDRPVRPLLKAARQAGPLLGIDHWLIDRSLETIRRYDRSRPLHLHIPLSAAALDDEDLLSGLGAKLDGTGVQPGQLTFVLYSDDARQHLARAKKTIADLNRLGCSTMLDGFGVSADDQALLNHLPALSGVRFDASLSTGLEAESDRIEHLREATSILHQLGLRAAVTEVENANALAQVWGLGIDFIQGEFLSPPLEHPEFAFA